MKKKSEMPLELKSRTQTILKNLNSSTSKLRLPVDYVCINYEVKIISIWESSTATYFPVASGSLHSQRTTAASLSSLRLQRAAAAVQTVKV